MSPHNSFSSRPSLNRRPSFNDHPTKTTEQTASRTPSPTNVCMVEQAPPQRKKGGMLSNLRASVNLKSKQRRRSISGDLSNSSIGSSTNGMEQSGSSAHRSLNLSGRSSAAEAHLLESNYGSGSEEDIISNSTGVTASTSASSRPGLGRLSTFSTRRKKQAQFSNHSSHHSGYIDSKRSSTPTGYEDVPLPSNSEHNDSLTDLTDQFYASAARDCSLRRSSIEEVIDENEDWEGCSSRRRASSLASSGSADDPNELDNRYESEALLERLGEKPSEEELSKITTARVSEILHEQSMEDRVRFANIPRFTKTDVLIGKHLGKGSFSDVFDVHVTLESHQNQMGADTSLQLNDRIRAKFGNSVGSGSNPSSFEYKPVNKTTLPPVFKMGGGSSTSVKSGVSTGSSKKSSDNEYEDDLNKFINAKFGGGASSDDEDEGEDLDKFIDTNFAGGASSDDDDGGEDLDTSIDAKFRGGDVDRCASAPPEVDLDKIIEAKFGDNRRSSDPTNNNEDFKEKADVVSDFIPSQLSRPPRRQRRVTTDLSSSMCVGSVSAPRTMGRSRRLNLAMKCLHPISRSDPQKFMIGMEDLVHETVMLSSFEHPNIIKIHGRAELGEGYFILLDKLTDTLDDRIMDWGKKFPQSSRNPPSMQQIKVGKTLADTVAFLHERKIVFHDLKPQNVGFDDMGRLKLFDFGFASEMIDDEPLEDRAGTVRYMAPEVGLDKGHGLPADVYSFSILLWEIFSLKKPFAKIKNSKEFKKVVFEGGERPKLGKNWSIEMREELESGWSEDPHERPNMDDFAELLSKWQRQCPVRPKMDNGNSLRASFARTVGRRI
mmetsp:Transcript_23754/g.38676  ORF Transcript_23754/g.38676 Transcript_23754/m.38676 type:complete len:829 (+) Transcript_23754:165-2651(+)